MSQDHKHLFDSYPFPKHLAVNLKAGHYRVTAKDGTSEIMQGHNAKDALSKSTLGNVEKLEYLGFYNKSILAAEEVIEQQEEDLTSTDDIAKSRKEQIS
jgi:hypothetical protein